MMNFLTTHNEEKNFFFSVWKDILNCKYNKSLVHQVVISYKSKLRKGFSVQKNRSEVSGSKKKPWKQKGTGRARAGSVTSPIWRSGGVTFAGKLQNYRQKINKKMYRGAMKCIFSELFRKNRLIVVKDFVLKQPKTKFLVQKLNQMHLHRILLITEKKDKNLFLASRNLHQIKIKHAKNIDPISLIYAKKVVITFGSVEKIRKMLCHES